MLSDIQISRRERIWNWIEDQTILNSLNIKDLKWLEERDFFLEYNIAKCIYWRFCQYSISYFHIKIIILNSEDSPSLQASRFHFQSTVIHLHF